METKEVPVCRIVRHLFPPAPHDDSVKRKLVRSMHPEAVQSWARLYDELKLYPIGPQAYEELSSFGSRHVFWAIEPSEKMRVLGMMSCTPIQLLGSRIGVIHDFIVARKHQRQGIAEVLLEAVIAWTREAARANDALPIHTLQTCVSERLRSATNFVQKHRFRRITEDEDAYYELDILPDTASRLTPVPR
jgi:GNAT superfamily N-acetyltransferase